MMIHVMRHGSETFRPEKLLRRMVCTVLEAGEVGTSTFDLGTSIEADPLVPSSDARSPGSVLAPSSKARSL